MNSSKQPTSVLFVDDEAPLRRALARYFRRVGYEVRCAATVAEGRSALVESDVDVAFVDCHLPDGSGAEFIRWAVDNQRVQSVFCMTARANRHAISEVMRAGCKRVLEKPLDVSRLVALIDEQRPTSRTAGNERLVHGAEHGVGSTPHMEFEFWREHCTSNILGDDERLVEALRTVHSVADTECTVLIIGESGTGKELIARSLHDASPRAGGPFVALNCAAIPETMVEAELFGHARGSFTGAHANRAGRVAAANGGTLFLDEIGDMPLSAQAKLLRLLQEYTIIPVGSDIAVKVDLRVVAATNQDLEAMVAIGRFRLDLFYRLNVIPIELPPLRERSTDIVTLAEHFLRDANLRNRRQVTGLDTSAEGALKAHHWPGNVRELAQLMERTVLLKGSGVVKAPDLRLRRNTRRGPSFQTSPTDNTLDLRSAMDDFERRLIDEALARTSGNRTEAAALLGVNRTTLVEKIRKHGTVS